MVLIATEQGQSMDGLVGATLYSPFNNHPAVTAGPVPGNKDFAGPKIASSPSQSAELDVFDLIFEAATHLWKNNDQKLVGSGVVSRLDCTGTWARRSALETQASGRLLIT